MSDVASFLLQLLGAAVAGYYCGTLVYSSLTTQKQVRKRIVMAYCTWLLTISVHERSKVLRTFSDCTEKKRSSRIVLAHFWCKRFINDSCYLPTEKSAKIQRRTQSRKNDVSFVQISSLDTASELKDYLLVTGRTL